MATRDARLEAERLFLEMFSKIRLLHLTGPASREVAGRGALLVKLGLLAVAGCEEPTPDNVVRALRVLDGARPENDDGVRLARLVRAIEWIGETGGTEAFVKDPEKWFRSAMRRFVEIDPSLSVTPSGAQRIYDLLQLGVAPSGIAADLLKMSGALGTKRRDKRATIQRRVAMAVKRRPMSRSK